MAKSRRRTKRSIREQIQPFSIWKQFLIGFFVLFSVLTFSILYVLESATKPFVTVEDNARKVAKEFAHLAEISDVTIFNGKESFYTVKGKDASGQEVFVLVPETSSTIYLYPVSDGISEEEAKQRAVENGAGQIDKTVFGYQDGHAIWEVKSAQAYYLIDFKTGELIKKEGL